MASYMTQVEIETAKSGTVAKHGAVTHTWPTIHDDGFMYVHSDGHVSRLRYDSRAAGWVYLPEGR